MSRFHVLLWGSGEKPDLDFYADELPAPEVLIDYPCRSIALLQPISRAAIEADLAEHHSRAGE